MPAHHKASVPPIPLDSLRSCPGQKRPIKRDLMSICIGCDRQDKALTDATLAPIVPAAYTDASRMPQCADRRYSGAAVVIEVPGSHDDDIAAPQQSGPSLTPQGVASHARGLAFLPFASAAGEVAALASLSVRDGTFVGANAVGVAE